MKCPYCNHPDTKVTDSREADDGIRRRRECLDCGRRFTTYERIQALPLIVVKKDGRREEFSREKVREGIRRASDKLPINSAQIDAIVDDIESALRDRPAAEIPSQDVGDLVMDSLRELSYAAYVRFASHYRDFVSLEELQAEIERSRVAPRRTPRRSGAAQPPLLPPTALDSQPASQPIDIEQRPRRAARGSR
ncbi:MAG: transcriptional repressor NrdR [Dehalococcoidia bacterium]|nr:transcriptional repressor NrdR [Dehalococcoidia bacterium]